MKLVDLYERKPVGSMSNKQRHVWAKFIHSWLNGSYMTVSDSRVETHWKRFSQMFPHNISGNIRLLRIMTIPIKYEGVSKFVIKPAPHNVSSWTGTTQGLVGVEELAIDVQQSPDNMRVGVRAIFSPDNILATPQTINEAFNYLTRDYMDRYPEEIINTHTDDGRVIRTTHNKGYTDFEPDSAFDMDEIDYTQSKLEMGSDYDNDQNEYVILSPEQISVEVLKTYRVGTEWVD